MRWPSAGLWCGCEKQKRTLGLASPKGGVTRKAPPQQAPSMHNRSDQRREKCRGSATMVSAQAVLTVAPAVAPQVAPAAP